MNKELFIQVSTLNKIINHKSESPSEYFRIYFDIGYFFCFLPYKFIKSSTTGLYTIRTNSIHQVLAAVFHFIIIFRLLNLSLHIKTGPEDPQSYFRACSLFAALNNKILFSLTIWKYKMTFLNIFNELDKYSNENPFQGHRRSWTKFDKMRIRVLARLICALGLVVAFASTIVGHGIIKGISNWTPKQLIIRNSEEWVKYSLFFKNSNSTITNMESLNDYSIETYVLGIIHLIAQFYRHLVGTWSDLLILMTAITFKVLANHFEDSYRAYSGPEGGHQRGQLLQQYNNIKAIVDELNTAIGLALLGYTLEAMIYYSNISSFIVGTNEWFDKLRYTYFLCIFLNCIFISARSVCQISQFQNWLNDGNNKSAISLTSVKLITLIIELNSNRVGLSALGLFTITYGTVGSAISIILTYAVITLQMIKS